MKIPVSWLKDFVTFHGSVEELAETLTMNGLEVEGVETLDDGDQVLDVSITPNRADCLSILGVSREVAAITGLSLSIPWKNGLKTASAASGVPVSIHSPELCQRYIAARIDGVRVGPSPEWLVRRLGACGVRAVNNVVDCTNYVLLELGQPLHAFDLDLLRGPEIRVRTAHPGERIKTLDGRDRSLDPSMLVIADASSAVAIAGIMGGAESEVSVSTRSVLIEGAWFTPFQVRRTAKALKLSTEASYRFERGVDPRGVLRAVARAVDLICEIAGGSFVSLSDAQPVPFEKRSLSVRPARANRIIGTELSARDMEEILVRIGFEVTERGEERISGHVPSHRLDITEEIDLIEEIARLHGYGSIPVRVPKGVLAVSGPRPSDLPSRIRASLTSQGMDEIISYSFCSPRDIDALGLSKGSPLTKAVRIQNPLSDDQGLMRTTLMASLLNAVAFNGKRRNLDLRLFEIGAVYEAGEQGKLPREEKRVAGIWTGARHPDSWGWPREGADVYDIKGVVEVLLEAIGIGPWSVREGTPAHPFYAPGLGARIVLDGDLTIGTFGEIDPGVLARFDISARVYAFDISIDALEKAPRIQPQFRHLPRFPFVERDVAVILSQSVRAEDVLDRLRKAQPSVLESVTIFDMYQGKAIPKGKKSLGLRFRYRAQDRTLTEDEVNGIHSSLVSNLLSSFEGVLRQ
ncbi:MAG: phenylalanine--tRNA ligase subunit beta [Deltaproteobacteria bacterium]